MDGERIELVLVMPVYNEEELVGGVLRKWARELQRLSIAYQIHAYNDGSKDGTLKVLEGCAEENTRIIVHDKINSGHGPTILKGYKEHCNIPWIFQTDSDDEINPDAFHELWSKRDDYDFLIGKRVYEKRPVARVLVSHASKIAVNIFYGRGIEDVNSPYRLMRTDLFKNYFLNLPEFTFAPNVILSGVACKEKLRIYEVPVHSRPCNSPALFLWPPRTRTAADYSAIESVDPSRPIVQQPGPCCPCSRH